MHLPSTITNTLALANSAWSSALAASADFSSSLVSKIMMGVEFKELDSMCWPPTANSMYNLSFPCAQFDVIKTQCYYGRTFDEVWNSTAGDYANTTGWTPQGPLNQRLAACESHFFDTLAGCNSCYKAHGGGADVAAGYLDEAQISSMSSSYCAASSTPTVGLLNMMSDYYKSPKVASMLKSELSEAKTSTYSDPLAGSTAFSYYYTPSVTGTAVFNIAGVTHGAKPTETNVKHGQITANSGAGAIGSGLGGVKVAFAAVLTLMASVVVL